MSQFPPCCFWWVCSGSIHPNAQSHQDPVILSLERPCLPCLFLCPHYPGPQCHISARGNPGEAELRSHTDNIRWPFTYNTCHTEGMPQRETDGTHTQCLFRGNRQASSLSRSLEPDLDSFLSIDSWKQKGRKRIMDFHFFPLLYCSCSLAPVFGCHSTQLLCVGFFLYTI